MTSWHWRLLPTCVGRRVETSIADIDQPSAPHRHTTSPVVVSAADRLLGRCVSPTTPSSHRRVFQDVTIGLLGHCTMNYYLLLPRDLIAYLQLMKITTKLAVANITVNASNADILLMDLIRNPTMYRVHGWWLMLLLCFHGSAYFVIWGKNCNLHYKQTLLLHFTLTSIVLPWECWKLAGEVWTERESFCDDSKYMTQTSLLLSMADMVRLLSHNA